MKRFIVLILMFTFIKSNATNYYVSNSGSDSNNGSEGSPWQTMNFAVQQLQPGDTLYVLSGVYNEYCTIEQQATHNNPIVIKTIQGQEHQAIMDGTGVTILYQGQEEENGGLIQMVGASHIIIKGIKFRNSPKEGIIAFESSNILIDNIYATTSQSSGIMAWNCSNVQIKNCIVNNACLGQLQEYITIGQTANFEVTNCLVQNSDLGSQKEGIDAKDGSNNGIIAFNRVENLQAPGIYLDAWTEETSSIEVYCNIVDNCNGIALASEGGGLLHDVNVYNNIIFRNINYGIVFGNWGDHPADIRPISDINIYHNTIIENGISGDWDIGISLENQYLSNISIVNNIVANNTMAQISNESNLANSEINVSGNLIFGDTTYYAELTNAINVYADPLLDENENYQPLFNSPIIDAANPNNQVAFDFSQGIRPYDGDNDGVDIADIGAWEYSPTMQDENLITLSLSVYPNPTSGTININCTDRISKIQLVNISGKVIYEKDVDEMKTIRIDLSEFPKGFYLMKMLKTVGFFTEKIILK